MRHDRPVDKRPAGFGHAEPGTVLGGYVSRPIEVGVEVEATLPADEQGAGAAVVPCGMAAPGASLRGMPGIDQGHRTTPLFRFVLDELSKLGETPGMDTPSLLAMPGPDMGTDVGQVLQGDGGSRRRGLDDPLAQGVIAVPAEAGLLAPRLPQASFRALGSPLLQGPLVAEVSTFGISPSLVSQETGIRRDGGLGYPKVRADNCIRLGYLWGGNVQADMEPEVPAAFDEVGGARLARPITPSILRNPEWQGHPPGDSGQPDGLGGPVEFEGMEVVPGWAGARMRGRHLAALLRQDDRGFDGLGGPDSSLDMEVAHKGRILKFQQAIETMVEGHAVPLAMLPTVGTDGVKNGGKLPGCLGEGGGLLWSREESEPYGAIHSWRTSPGLLSHYIKNTRSAQSEAVLGCIESLYRRLFGESMSGVGDNG